MAYCMTCTGVQSVGKRSRSSVLSFAWNYVAWYGRYYHTIPSPKSRPSEGLSRYIRVAPWGPKPDFLEASSELPSELPSLEVDQADYDYSAKLSRSAKKTDILTPDSFQRVGEILRKYDMNPKEIQRNPALFAIPPKVIELRLETFKECGWESFSADMIVFAHTLLSKRTAKDLIGSESESVTRSVLRCLLDELEVEESRQQQLLSGIGQTTAAVMTLHDCRCLALRQHFRSIYSEEEITRLLKMALKPVGDIHTVKGVKRVLDILIQDFKVPPDRAIKYEALVTRDQYHFESHLNNPKVMGCDKRLLTYSYPRILAQTTEHLKTMEAVLNKYDISSFHFSRVCLVSSLSPVTIEKRLEALKADPDLWKYHAQPDFLQLVIQYASVMRRVNFLRSMDVKDFGFNLLTCSREQFHVASSRGLYRAPPSGLRPQHLLPVAEWLGMPLTAVKRHLRSQIRNIPFFANSSKEVEDVLKCLTEFKITTEQFMEGMSVVLYPGDLVRRHLGAVVDDPSMAERRQQKNLLHYAIYTMEKESNFAGPAAWAPARSGESGDTEGDELDIVPGDVEDFAEQREKFQSVRNAMTEGLAQHFPASEDFEKNEIVAENERDDDQKGKRSKEWFQD